MLVIYQEGSDVANTHCSANLTFWLYMCTIP